LCICRTYWEGLPLPVERDCTTPPRMVPFRGLGRYGTMRPSNIAARLLPRGLSIARMPAQFHLLVGGSLLSSAGYTLSFPFLTIYLSTVLGIPMDRVGLVFTGNAIAGFLAQGIAGPVADQLGRKPVMVGGLLGQGLVALAFTQAQSFEQFALLGFLNGFFGSMYFPASNAMVVDLVGKYMEPKKPLRNPSSANTPA